MKIDAATDANATSLQPEPQNATVSQADNERTLQQRSNAAPGAALAALSSSPAAITATIDSATSVSAEQAERIDNALQQLESNPDQLLTLLSESVAMT